MKVLAIIYHCGDIEQLLVGALSLQGFSCVLSTFLPREMNSERKMSQQLGIFSYFAEIDADGSGLLDREEVRGEVGIFTV